MTDKEAIETLKLAKAQVEWEYPMDVSVAIDMAIESLANQCKEQKQIGFEDDELFLLSTEEYEKYKEIIPKTNQWWWLRSAGGCNDSSAFVLCDGSVYFNGRAVDYDNVSVLPALRIEESQNLKVGECFIKYKFPWIYLGEGLAIAEVPIATHRFDGKSNDYEKSEIRQFLKEWKEERDD